MTKLERLQAESRLRHKEKAKVESQIKDFNKTIDRNKVTLTHSANIKHDWKPSILF